MGKQEGEARRVVASPHIPNATLRRSTLLARLHGASDRRLILVSAAAGSGKSALLADWASELTDPVAWYSCTDADADHATFWERLEQRLLAAFAPIGMVGAEVLTSSAGGTPADRLVHQLAALERRGVVIVDDLHLAGVPPAELVALIAGLPPAVQLVLSTRVDPPFSLARMRLHGTLLELRQEDLRFTAEESAEALAPLGLELPPEEAQRLHQVAEGWPAGVHLLGLALRDRPDRGALLDELVAHDRNLGDFLLAEVIDRQPPEVREFLLATALLDAFDVELHRAITGRTDGAALLEEVRRRNLFLVEVEGTAGTYRYHHLFQGFLRLRFGLVDPKGRDEAHRRAATALSERGDTEGAVRHLLACGAVDEARALLAQEIVMAGSVLRGGAAAARRWLAEHGEAQLGDDPSGLLECTMALDVAGAHAEAEHWLRRWQEAEPDLAHRPRVLLHGAWSFHHMVAGDPERSLVQARRARELMDLEPVDDGWMASLPVMPLQAFLWLGDVASIRELTSTARAEAAVSPAISLVRIPAFRAVADSVDGWLRRADATASGALAAADDLGLAPANFSRGEALLVRAEVAIDQARDADAEVHVEALLRVAEAGRPPMEVLAQLLVARLAAHRGDAPAAADALDRARGACWAPSTTVLARIDAVACHLALVRGDVAEGRAWAEALPPGATRSLLLARVALASGDVAGAAVHHAEAGPAADGPRARLEHGIVAALAAPPGQREHAVACAGEVAAVAAEHGFVRRLLDQGPPLWDLLAEVPATGATATFVGEVIEASRRMVPVARHAPQVALIDPLSERELTVLRYLASRLDSSEIAGALYISVNTVRSHVKAIYRKLGVNARPDAVARARELGLL